jgi:large subunit ribosomal protein L3
MTTATKAKKPANQPVGLLGRKIGMTQIFDNEGQAVPVTVVKLGDNIVTAKMSKEKNGYSALQIGGFVINEKKQNKAERGVTKKLELPSLKPLKEFRVDDTNSFNVGEPIKPETIFADGMLVDVQGKSIGKGFQGTIKRHNAGRGPMSHGSKNHRLVGSIGQHTDPGRVFKGLAMPGHMGDQVKTIRHITVVKVDSEKGLLLLKGATPGVEGGLLVIKPSIQTWNG